MQEVVKVINATPSGISAATLTISYYANCLVITLAATEPGQMGHCATWDHAFSVSAGIFFPTPQAIFTWAPSQVGGL